MLYVRRPVERVTPFLRDELFHAMGSGPDQDAKVQDLKELLGKQVSPTLVLAIGSDMPGATGEGWLVAQESARQRLAVALDEDIGQTRYLLLPVGAGRFAICLDLPEDQARVLADKLHASIAADAPVGSMAVGVGGTHPPRELQHSYLEAQTALRAAEASGQPVVSYTDLGGLPRERRFPVEVRDEFLLEFKHGHRDAARRRLRVLLDQVAVHADGNVAVYRVRLQELLGMLLSQLSDRGGATSPILAEGGAAFERMGRAKEIGELTRVFEETIGRLLKQVQPPPAETTSVNHLERARVYIDEHLAEDLKIADVAKRAGVRTQRLQQIFRESLGMTYSTYLTTTRMQKAKELLAGTDHPITQIAFEVGYNDSNYFSTAFRKHEGISPRQYRKQGK